MRIPRTIIRISVATASAASVAIAAVLLAPPAGDAHELAEASATLVVRDGGHVELRLQVPWAVVLHQRIMPGAAMQEFLVRMTNLRPAEFATQLTAVQGRIERETKLTAEPGKPAAFQNWHWPAAGEVQDAMRRELMSRLADGANFEHASRLSAAAETVVGRERSSARLVLAPLLGPALLTVIRPHEEWMRAGEPSAPVVLR